MIKINRYMHCVCNGFVNNQINTNIPASIKVNLANAKNGDTIRMNTVHNGVPIVTLPEGVRLNKRLVAADMLIGVVKSGK